MIRLKIRGQPVPAGREAKAVGPKYCPAARARCTRRPVLAWRSTYTGWKDQARPQVERAMLELDPVIRRLLPLYCVAVSVDLTFVFRRPKKRPVYNVHGITVRYPLPWTDERAPMLGMVDWENLAKGPCDLLVECGILQDDRWIVQGQATKVYAALGEVPHVAINLRVLPGSRSPQGDLPWLH